MRFTVASRDINGKEVVFRASADSYAEAMEMVREEMKASGVSSPVVLANVIPRKD